METPKVKFEQVVGEVALDTLFDSLGKARGMYKDLSDKELALVLGLSEFQYDHLVEAFKRKLTENIEMNLVKHLEAGNSIEVHKSFNIFVYESDIRKNESGDLARKVSIRTRRALKERLN